jgi:hypothetical protein
MVCVAALGSQLLSLKKQILDFDVSPLILATQTSGRRNCNRGPPMATKIFNLSASHLPTTLYSDSAQTGGTIGA